jgi:hypothetical protein
MFNRIRNGVLVFLGLASAAHGAPISIEGAWFVATAQKNGNEIVFRVRGSMPSSDVVGGHPILATVEWPYEARANGMPELSVARKQYEFEDSIENEIESTGVCIRAFARTGNGMRQWNYYISDKHEFVRRLEEIKSKSPDLRFSVSFNADPGWDALRELQKAAPH